MVKMKLMPTLKEDRHYLVFEGDKDKVEQALLEFLGILGYAKAGPILVEYSKGKGIISFNRKHADEVKSALLFYNIHTLGISGTIKRAKAKFL